MSKKNNEEKYIRSFNALHLSGDFQANLDKRLEEEREGRKMNLGTIGNIRRIAAGIAVFAVTMGSFGVCYASDFGGLRTNLKLWLGGEEKEVTVVQSGDYSYDVIDEDGNVSGFGGLTADGNGGQTAMSAEQLAALQNNACMLKPENGRYILYYKNISADVTDQIKNGKLNIHITDPNNEYTYFRISEINGESFVCEAGRKADWGVDYIEIDSSSLTDDGASFETDCSDDVSFTTSVISD